MAQDSHATSGEPSGEDAAAGLTAIERVQRELAETRTTLQGEATQISQLQEALETALRVARGVRLEALNQLDRLAGELMDAARRDAAAIRADAEADAQRLRAAAEAEAEAIRAAAKADAAEDRAEIARRLRDAQAELDRIEAALSEAMQTLGTARHGLLAGTDELLAAPPGTDAAGGAAAPAPAATGAPTISPLIPTEVASASAAPSRPPLDLEDHTFGPQSGWRSEPLAPETAPSQKDENTQEVPVEPQPPVSATPWAAARAPASPAPAAEAAAQPEPASEAPAAPAEAPAAPAASGGVLDEANSQLAAGDVAGALDTMRAIVDRQPEQVEPVIARLTSILQDPQYRGHYEEVRLLLVDAYMVQGDYDRAMSLLHEPSS